MHKLLEIKNSATTRDLVLKNEKTNTVDVCFDDSELLSLENFNFVTPDSCYSCKIYLFGEYDETGEEFTIVGNEFVGSKQLTKVKNNQEDY